MPDPGNKVDGDNPGFLLGGTGSSIHLCFGHVLQRHLQKRTSRSASESGRKDRISGFEVKGTNDDDVSVIV